MMKNPAKNKKIIIAAVACVLVLLIAAGSIFYYQNSLTPVSSSDEVVVFEIKEGDSSEMILKNLEEQGFIHNAFTAKFYMKNHNLSDFKYGLFNLNQSWDLNQILKTLNDANEAHQNAVSITFREGMWAKDIAKLLSDKLGIDQTALLKLWNDNEYLNTLMTKYPFLSNEILNDGTRVKLEGYLFPQTYFFDKDITLQGITETFLDHFDTIYQKKLEDIKNSGMTMQTLVTMASMVQYEASTSEDMKLIAGVFNNRLKAGMKLQSSVTVCYALYDNLTSGEDCEVNPGLESPYNTYLHEGLPVGPILNPGEDAIDAVLHPTSSDYLYFVADIYGDGAVYYSKTYDEQLANQEKFNLNK